MLIILYIFYENYAHSFAGRPDALDLPVGSRSRLSFQASTPSHSQQNTDGIEEEGLEKSTRTCPWQPRVYQLVYPYTISPPQLCSAMASAVTGLLFFLLCLLSNLRLSFSGQFTSISHFRF